MRSRIIFSYVSFRGQSELYCAEMKQFLETIFCFNSNTLHPVVTECVPRDHGNNATMCTALSTHCYLSKMKYILFNDQKTNVTNVSTQLIQYYLFIY